MRYRRLSSLLSRNFLPILSSSVAKHHYLKISLGVSQEYREGAFLFSFFFKASSFFSLHLIVGKLGFLENRGKAHYRFRLRSMRRSRRREAALTRVDVNDKRRREESALAYRWSQGR